MVNETLPFCSGMNCIPLRSILNQPLPPVPPSDQADNVWKPPPSPGRSGAPPQIPTTKRPSAFRKADHALSLDDSGPSVRDLPMPRSRTIGETSNPVPPDDDDYENADLPLPTPAPPPGRSALTRSGVAPIPEGNEAAAPSVEMEGLKASMKFLQSLVEAMQENTRKEFKSLRGEISGLKDTVESLTEQNNELQAQVALSQRSAPSPLGNWIYWRAPIITGMWLLSELCLPSRHAIATGVGSSGSANKLA